MSKSVITINGKRIEIEGGSANIVAQGDSASAGGHMNAGESPACGNVGPDIPDDGGDEGDVSARAEIPWEYVSKPYRGEYGFNEDGE